MKHPTDNIDKLINTEKTMQEDEFLDHYLQKKSFLSKQYLELDTPTPSDKLDKTILAAAHQQANKRLWWRRPSSWAASIAIVSLAGLLTHNLWLSEQNSLPQSSISDSQPDLLSESDTLEDSGFSSEEKAVNTYVPAQKVLLKDKSKDSRQLRYQAAPAPVMSPRAEPLGQSYIESRLKKESIPMEAMTGLAADEAPATLLEKEQLQPSVYRDTNIEGESVPINEPQQWLQTIEQYLQKGQTEQARQLLEQLRKKYPEYPVDPVILQQLSPY